MYCIQMFAQKIDQFRSDVFNMLGYRICVEGDRYAYARPFYCNLPLFSSSPCLPARYSKIIMFLD